MSFFDQAKLATNMMKNMNPSEIRDLMKQAKEAKKQMDQQVEESVEKTLRSMDVVSREEFDELKERLETLENKVGSTN